ncbi:DUF6193 family natural product biosynthesis protein [Kitasatospora sp. NPDC059571]|uniref:DUF6193 family natural product biosynthesis protein n=1 Tax=Kitasatospora sp. NPDC059571 TaxID=3346871 RepID=UPI0036C4ACE0
MTESETPPTESDDPVAAEWRRIREMDRQYINKELVEAAYADPVLARLFPLVSHCSLQFSRCTRYPWSGDLPSVFPYGGELFYVALALEPGAPRRERIGGPVTAEQAVELLARHLPAGCGPAVDGTPDVLEPLG